MVLIKNVKFGLFLPQNKTKKKKMCEEVQKVKKLTFFKRG